MSSRQARRLAERQAQKEARRAGAAPAPGPGVLEESGWAESMRRFPDDPARGYGHWLIGQWAAEAKADPATFRAKVYEHLNQDWAEMVYGAMFFPDYEEECRVEREAIRAAFQTPDQVLPFLRCEVEYIREAAQGFALQVAARASSSPAAVAPAPAP